MAIFVSVCGTRIDKACSARVIGLASARCFTGTPATTGGSPNSIASLRAHFSAPLSFDENWIGDFLQLGLNLDAKRSVFREIRRFPAAHEFSVGFQGTGWRRYWTLELAEPLFYRDKRQYIDQFRDLLETAIRDRLPEGRVGILLSGGLDSSALAAATAKLVGESSRMIARTNCFEHLIPDEEKYFSSLVASQLGVRQEIMAADELFYDPVWDERETSESEPSLDIVNAAKYDRYYRSAAETARVWFYGEGPDNALTFEWQPYLRWLWARDDRIRFSRAVLDYATGKSAHEWLSTVTSRLKRPQRAAPRQNDAPPNWMSESLVRHLNLSKDVSQQQIILNHPWRPEAVEFFSSPIWARFFEGFEASPFRAEIDWRHPYLDLRMLNFMLRTPPIPWGRRKQLIREAMRGVLPQEVLTRDKAPLAQDPLLLMLRKYPLRPRSLCAATLRFVNAQALPQEPQTSEEIYDVLRVRVLDHWLSRQKS